MNDRTCGDCTLCCKVMAVHVNDETELSPAGAWCKHCNKKADHGGCRIYDDRPQDCRDFECQWVYSGALPETMKPNLSRVVVSEKDGILFFNCDPARPDACKSKKVRPIINSLTDSHIPIAIIAPGRPTIANKYAQELTAKQEEDQE